jgi:uncharacterized surface protein with fasciclin (FAS1) repeats
MRKSFMPNFEEVLLASVSPLTCYAFHTLMNAVGKSYILQGQHPITVFVPSDAAFEALHEGAVYDLLKNPAKLEHLLDFHVVPMKLTRSDVASFASQLADREAFIIPDSVQAATTVGPRALQVETLSGHPLTVTLTEEELQVNRVKVYQADIVADNGVVHVIESILWPPELSEASFVPEIQYRNVLSVRVSPG